MIASDNAISAVRALSYLHHRQVWCHSLNSCDNFCFRINAPAKLFRNSFGLKRETISKVSPFAMNLHDFDLA